MKLGNFTQNYTFTDKELDPESGLQDFGARYYNNQLGRFIQVDPISLIYNDNKKFKEEAKKDLHEFLQNPQDLNNYSYAANNPIVFVDPTGLAKIYIRQGGIINSNTYNPRNWTSWFGHSMINVGDKYYGFAPTTNKEHDVQDYSKEDFRNKYDDQKWNVVDIGNDYDEKIKAEFEKLKENGQNSEGGEYRALTNNCTQKIDEILQDVGFSKKTGWTIFTPDELLNKMKTIKLVDSVKSLFNWNYKERIKGTWQEKIDENW